MTIGYVTVSADTSDIDHLQQILAAARERPHKERAAVLDRRAGDAETEARAIVATYNKKSTGALADAITREGTPVFQRIFANVREASLLERGTPNTGAPRPWLTGPAQKAADAVLEDLTKSAEPW